MHGIRVCLEELEARGFDFFFRFSAGVLTDLDISENYITDEGAKALASALRVNGVLTSISLSRNKIGSEGAAAIAEALRGNGVLKSIELRNNELGGDEGKGAIRDAVSGRVGFELEM